MDFEFFLSKSARVWTDCPATVKQGWHGQKTLALFKNGLIPASLRICCKEDTQHIIRSHESSVEGGLCEKRSFHDLFLRSWGILKMNFRYFHEIPVFIFLVSCSFIFWIPHNIPVFALKLLFLFLGNIYLYYFGSVVFLSWMIGGKRVGSHFYLTFCHHFTIWWRFYPFSTKAHVNGKGPATTTGFEPSTAFAPGLYTGPGLRGAVCWERFWGLVRAPRESTHQRSPLSAQGKGGEWGTVEVSQLSFLF